ncbi:MAG: hypothetical protein ABIZ49_09900 [Opitutaceae bacterium]
MSHLESVASGTAPLSPPAELGMTEIRVKGKDTNVPSVRIGRCTVLSTGRWLRHARLFDEELVERADLLHPDAIVPALRRSPLKADIFSFSQRVPDTTPHFPYALEWDNWAVAPTTSFQTWWDALPQESRKNARQAEKRGVVVKAVAFDDALVHGIKCIYDETPVRQGRPFWHYGKNLEAVKKENGTYLDRSFFVGAYLNDALIGFIKIIGVDEFATLIQILAMAEHRDKKPMNALLKTTMELCELKGFGSLVYGQYHYGTNNDSSLTEFKRRNGFVEVRFPRYVVPLTLPGKAAIASGLHRGWRHLVPKPVTSFLVKARGKVLKTRVT